MSEKTKYREGQWVCADRNGTLVYTVIRYVQIMNRFPFEQEYLTDHGMFRETQIKEAR